MKKIVIMFLLISILFMFSCNNTNTSKTDNLDNGNANSYISSDDKGETDDSVDEKKSNALSGNSGGAYSEIGGFHLSTYEEYLDYIENTELPEGFVYYDDIKEIGDFESLAAPQGINPNSDDSIGYMFNLLYKGKRISLSVVNVLDIELEELYDKDDIQVDLSDMRYPISGKTGIVIHNDIRYIYLEGELYLIRWYENGWSYTINTLYRDVTDFPDNDGSALANLIYLE